jgi:hypothetical protein
MVLRISYLGLCHAFGCSGREHHLHGATATTTTQRKVLVARLGSHGSSHPPRHSRHAVHHGNGSAHGPLYRHTLGR